MGLGWLLFGSLGLLSVQGPRMGWELRNSLPWPLGNNLEEMRNVGMLLMFLAVLLVIAYFTNPNEDSFRTFLTEMTFRRHLIKLHKAPVANTSNGNSSQSYSPSLPGSADVFHGRIDDENLGPADTVTAAETEVRPPGFPLANWASVSLRTAPHMIRSFGLFTIGAMTPVYKLSQSTVHESLDNVSTGTSTAINIHAQSAPSATGSPGSASTSSTLADTLADESAPEDQELSGLWFIGAFGTWWICGSLINSSKRMDQGKDAQDKAGIISVRTDQEEPIKGLFSPAPAIALSKPGNGLAARCDELPSRSSTPPPLPKSAVLPLHAPHTPASNNVKSDMHLSPDHIPMSRMHSTIESSPPNPSSLAPPSPPQPLHQDPAVLELQAQVRSSEATVTDLKEELAKVETSSTEAHKSLVTQVEQQRERKRAEDQERGDVRSRTRALEESKRHAENGKKEAEKKLRAVQASRDTVARKKDTLEKEIGVLKEKVEGYAERKESNLEEIGMREQLAREEAARRKGEIKGKEGDVASLSARAQTLEEKISETIERLTKAKEDEQRKRAQEKAETVARIANVMFERTILHREAHPERYDQPQQDPFRGGVPHIHTRSQTQDQHGLHAPYHGLLERRQITHNQRATSGPPASFVGSSSYPAPIGNRNRAPSLKGLRLPPVNLEQATTTSSAIANAISARAKGYAIFDRDIAAAGNSAGAYSGFSDGDSLLRSQSLGTGHTLQAGNGQSENLLSPAAASFLPSNLLVEPSPRMMSDSDPFFHSPIGNSPMVNGNGFGHGNGHGNGHRNGHRRGSRSSERRDSRDSDWLIPSGLAVGSQREAHKSDASLQKTVSHQLFDRVPDQPPSTAPAGRSSFEHGYDDQRAYFQPRHADSQTQPHSVDDDGEQSSVNAEGKARRWFSKKVSLNPDAKVFTPPFIPPANTSFQGRFLPLRGGSQQPRPNALFTDLPVTASSGGPSFFSSLIAFQPSLDELKALNTSQASISRETVNSFGSANGIHGMDQVTSPSSLYAPGLPSSSPYASPTRPGSENSSQVSFGQGRSAVAAAWDAAGPSSPTASRRSFARFFSKSKDSINIPGEAANSPGPIERPSRVQPTVEHAEEE